MNPDFPEEYTRGQVSYLGHTIFVTHDVLIPRLETEVLIKRARKILQNTHTKTILDIGTGSGIIPISLRNYTEGQMYAVDISPEALLIAEKNFRYNLGEKQCTFMESNLLENIPNSSMRTPLLITANLPYIRNEDWGNMSADTRYEPQVALFGGEKTGFELYEKLLYELAERQMDTTILLIEFGYDQLQNAQDEVEKYGWKSEVFSDYAGIPRFMQINIDI